jgi:trehalose 6-phosphate phosphatase
MHNLERFIAEIGWDPSVVAIFTDFDGTLAPIQADPASVQPVPGIVDRIDRLAADLGRVAIVSGRPVSFLQGFFSDKVELSGLYGIEHWANNRLLVDHTAIEWLPAIRTTVSRAIEEFGEAAVENKKYSLTLHHRASTDPDVPKRMEDWVRERADLIGLEARVARMSFELHPPLDRTKADAITDMLQGIESAIYIGDDVGDRPAFTLMTDLLGSGRLTAGAAVLVRSDETDPSLDAMVTDSVPGPQALPGVFDAIIDAVTSNS